MKEQFTKQEFVEILEEMMQKIKENQAKLPRIGKCLIEFLYRNQNTQTFEEFFNTFAFTKLKLINSGIQDYNQLKSSMPWEIIFEDIATNGEIGFIEDWIVEEDRELFYQFLEKQCNIILIPQGERFIKIIEEYLDEEVGILREYPFYWEKENKHRRLFDEYITFVYNNPNSKTAKKLLKIFNEKGNKFLENLKSQINNNNYLRMIRNLVDKEDLSSFTMLLRSKTKDKDDLQ